MKNHKNINKEINMKYSDKFQNQINFVEKVYGKRINKSSDLNILIIEKLCFLQETVIDLMKELESENNSQSLLSEILDQLKTYSSVIKCLQQIAIEMKDYETHLNNNKDRNFIEKCFNSDPDE